MYIHRTGVADTYHENIYRHLVLGGLKILQDSGHQNKRLSYTEKG